MSDAPRSIRDAVHRERAMGRLMSFVSVAAVAVAAISLAPAPRSDERTTEAAYREYFAARMSLLPTVTKQSSLFDAILADPTSRDEVFDEDDLGYGDWDADSQGEIAEVESLWQGDEAALLRVVTTPQLSWSGRADCIRLAVLIRQSPEHSPLRTSVLGFSKWKDRVHLEARSPLSKWQVAVDVGTTAAERRILRGKRLDELHSIDDPTERVCIAAIRRFIREEAVARWNEKRGWFDSPVRLERVLSTTTGSFVLAGFVEGIGDAAPDEGENKPSARGSFFIDDRWLLLTIESAAGRGVPVIRRIL